jgi:hypothetical protein
MKHFIVIAALAALTGAAEAQYVKPSPYATTTQEQARQQEKSSSALSEKLAAEKQKRVACRAEAKAQKISVMKRRAFVRDCVKR